MRRDSRMPLIQKVSYTHDAMIDLIIANPNISQGEIAAAFGYTEPWVSIIFNSDAFKERLAERKSELVDPVIRATLEEKFKALADLGTQVVLEKLAATRDPKLGLRALEITSKALGYGAKAPAQTAVQVNVQPVAVVPAKELSSSDWVRSFAPAGAPAVIDFPTSQQDDAA